MNESFVENAVTQLLRAQLHYAHGKLGRALYRQKRAEDLLSKYMTRLFSVAWGQAVASGADVLVYAEAFLDAWPGTTPATAAAAALTLLRQYLAVFTDTLAPDAPAETVLEVAQQQLPVVTQQWATRATPTFPPPDARANTAAAAADAVLRQYLAALQVACPVDRWAGAAETTSLPDEMAQGAAAANDTVADTNQAPATMARALCRLKHRQRPGNARLTSDKGSEL